MGVATVSRVELFAQGLAGAGCRRAFGLAGEDHVELIAALEAAGVRYIRAYNESAAVLMASAEAQAAEGFGVALVSMSTGMSNAVNGLAHAYMERVPVLVISGQHPAGNLPFIIRQGFDIESLVRPVTKWTARMASGMNPLQLLAKALFIATEEPKGPVYVELPADVGRGKADGDTGSWRPRLGQQVGRAGHGSPRLLEDREIAILESALALARRPLILVGGRPHMQLGPAVERLSQLCRMPMMVTPNQKGAVAPSAPYYAGVFLNGRPERRLLDQADVILAVNFEAFDIYSSGLAPSGVTLSLAGTAISDTFIAFSREIVGDPVDALERLGGRGVCTASEWTEDEIRGYRSQVRSELMRLDRVDNGLSVTDAVGALADALPGGAAVVADAGFSKPLLLHLWEPAKPKLFYASHSFGTMGHALPTAIALKLHSPDRPTVAVMGDGSLLMRVGELQTAADALVNPIVVVFMDGSLTQIAIKQTRRGLPKTGVDLPKLSAEAIATAFGCVGLDVYTAEDIGKAMAAALTSREVSVIGVHVDNRNANDVFEYIRG